MNKNFIYAALLVAAIGLIGVYVLDIRMSEEVDTQVNVSTDNRASEQASTGGGVINVDEEIERTKHLQTGRKEIMDGMVEGGLASRIENPSGSPFIYVMEPFYLLSTDEQVSLLNVILYYYMTEDRDSDVLTIFSDETGQEIGTYTPSGLLMGE